MFALDTNTVIYFFKGKGHVAEQLMATSPREIAVPSVVVYELEKGIAKSSAAGKRRQQLDTFLEAVELLPLDEGAARTAAKIRATLERLGTPIGPMDNLIAGIAKHYGATLVTHNLPEFARVSGLQCVDWY